MVFCAFAVGALSVACGSDDVPSQDGELATVQQAAGGYLEPCDRNGNCNAGLMQRYDHGGSCTCVECLDNGDCPSGEFCAFEETGGGLCLRLREAGEICETTDTGVPLDCEAGLTCCGSGSGPKRCVNTDVDILHCGSCGNSCDKGGLICEGGGERPETCAQGSCQDTCFDGSTDCTGTNEFCVSQEALAGCGTDGVRWCGVKPGVCAQMSCNTSADCPSDAFCVTSTGFCENSANNVSDCP